MSHTTKRDSFHKNSSDWTCSDSSCGNLNFARRTNCNRCEKPREDPLKKKGSVKIGTAAAKNSRGLFSADDWSCTKCGNINWARRNQCNICNAKKFVDEEERTGLGGGFNEREKVEYKQRRSSDSSEYDEFGRRKKKAETSRRSRRDRHRSSSSSTSSSSSSEASHRRRRSRSPKRSSVTKRRSKSRSRSRDKYRDSRKDNRKNEKQDIKREKSSSRSQSEESDDEGGDLSKYNLFDDDDIDIEALRKK